MNNVFYISQTPLPCPPTEQDIYEHLLGEPMFITGGYGSRKVHRKFFATPQLAEAFDKGVMASRWGQDAPRDPAELAGWEYEQEVYEKSRDDARWATRNPETD